MLKFASRSQLNRLKLLIAVCFWWTASVVSAQNSFQLRIETTKGNLKLQHEYDLPEEVNDSTEAIFQLQRLINRLQSDGYLLASVDQIVKDSSSITGLIHIGNQFRWGHLDIGKLPKELSRSVTTRGRKLITDDIDRSFSKILSESNNSGYPFASVKLDSVRIIDSQLFASVDYQSGPLIRFDSLNLKSSSAAERRYLSNYLRIRRGDRYSAKKVNQIPDYFENLAYYELVGPVTIKFHNQDALVGFELEKIKANQFDGIIGLLPNASREGKALLTGEINLQLLNLFSSGKELRFHWQRLREETQLLDLSVKLPHFLGSDIDLFGDYYQLKEDTTFINRNARIGLGLRMSPRSEAALFTDFKTANLLSSGEGVTISNLENVDFDLTKYGLSYSYNSLSYTNPKDQGLRLSSEISVGSRSINPSNDIDDSVFDNLDLKSTFYDFEIELSYQIALSRSITFFNEVSSGHLFSSNIFNNDMFRLGGINSLRGFNENQFFAKNYLLSNSEFRLHFEPRSFLFFFYDHAYIRTVQLSNVFEDGPVGFGAGLQLNTGVGDLKLAYALGRTRNQSVDLNQAKIHFGLINRF